MIQFEGRLDSYFYGGIVGAVIIGPAYDFILYGSAYMILDILIAISIVFQIVLLFDTVDHNG